MNPTSYTDSLFLTASAMTETGLNTLNLSSLNTFQQVLLFLLAILGSPILVSWIVVMFRKRAFEKKFREMVRQEKGEWMENKHGRKHMHRALVTAFFLKSHDDDEAEEHQELERKKDGEDYTAVHRKDTRREFNRSSQGHVSAVDKNEIQRVHPAPPTQPLSTAHMISGLKMQPHIRFQAATSKYLSTQTLPASTSQCDSTSTPLQGTDYLDSSLFNKAVPSKRKQELTRGGRLELGGIEYRAVRLLAWLVPLYFVVWQFFGALTMALYIKDHKAGVARDNGVGAWWLGIFLGVSAFNNCGLSLLDANMIPLGTNFYILCSLALLMLAGNTGYPLFLRAFLWIAEQLCPHKYEIHATIQFILDHPRRVYTHLFPALHTLYFLLGLIALSVIDWVAFELLDLHNPNITSLPKSARVVDGFFQSIANRAAGFDVISISQLAIGFQVLCVLMMYISVYPVAITLRSSNIYEDRALGIFGLKPSPDNVKEHSRTTFISHQVRLQLSHDLWWIVLSTFVIVVIQTSSFVHDPLNASVFNHMFEVVSAYGPVGLSVGLPTQDYSFCGSWKRGAKVVLCAVMLRGRHRGLPVAIDAAILLPGEGDGCGDVRRSSHIFRERGEEVV
ncbi:hypothetical protein BP5796_10202 [Coleophoma crateriformis]|uniref:Potassium transport protein n=1 Tax=Coleophoma crateriformis TaxID=565419 RepID=A0A3D8QV21_9HELO|nr:hypothetical protein BP5796_10202 [Coleophoma crateriformis]